MIAKEELFPPEKPPQPHGTKVGHDIPCGIQPQESPPK